jgi:hypothetical protein
VRVTEAEQQRILSGLASIAIALCLIVVTATSQAAPADVIAAVAPALPGNKLGIRASDLKSMKNPKGAGTFVYVPQTQFQGVERLLVWLVVDGKAFPLNGATKGTVTPSLPWPREAPKGLWQKTGLDPYSPAEALRIVFGK